MDQDAVDLIFLSMKQNHSALAASVIHGVVTRHEHGRCFQRDTLRRCADYLKADLWAGHKTAPCTGGSVTGLSATDAWHRAVGSDLDMGWLKARVECQKT
jgi:hypothetical protein